MVIDRGILDPEEHGRLIQSISDVSMQARVPIHFITQSASRWCTQGELAWLTHFNHPAVAKSGLVIEGKVDPISSIAAMCGALIRNYVDARVVMTHELIEVDPGNISVIAVPNFYQLACNAGSVAKWEAPQILEWLYSRFLMGKPCILHVENLDRLEGEYGPAIHSFLCNNYTILRKGS